MFVQTKTETANTEHSTRNFTPNHKLNQTQNAPSHNSPPTTQAPPLKCGEVFTMETRSGSQPTKFETLVTDVYHKQGNGFVEACLVHSSSQHATARDVLVRTPKGGIKIFVPEIKVVAPEENFRSLITSPVFMVSSEVFSFIKLAPELTIEEISLRTEKFNEKISPGHNMFTAKHYLARERSLWAEQLNKFFS